jgi:hypothetical protein
MPAPEDDRQRRLLQATWDLFFAEAKWPTFSQVDRKLDREFGIDAQITGQALPAELLYPPFEMWPRPDQELRLTIAGVAACAGSKEDVDCFLKVVLYAAEVEKDWLGTAADEEVDPILKASEVRRHVALPAAGRDELLRRLAHLLAVEPWGWRAASMNEAAWQFTISRDVRRFRGVRNLDEYWAIRVRHTERAGSSPRITERKAMGATGKIFISHATTDRRLADLLRDTLILGGVSEDRIFYSSSRRSGIPAGQDVRSHLREQLQEAGLIIELISETFLTRPMCLIELGGAWALEKATYPVVVPPLRRGEAVTQVGEVHMGLLDTESDIDEVFDELSDRLSSDVGLDVKATSWNRAIRKFKADLQAVLAVASATSAPSPNTPTAITVPPGSLDSKITVANCGVVAGRHGVEVNGEATNNDSAEHSASLKATFYDTEGKILGTADGIVSQLAPGETKTFSLTSLDAIPQHSRLKVQVDAIF